MKWFAWFLSAVLANSAVGAAKFFALLIPAAMLTFLLGTGGYIVGMCSLFWVMFCDVQSQSGDAFWVEMLNTSLWGYFLAGTVCILMAEVLTLPIAIAILVASGGLMYGLDKLTTWCEQKAAEQDFPLGNMTQANYC